jgi:hypothetical protein
MTEAEWLACADPRPMVEHVRGKASGRKLRLFAVACCRRIWQLLPDQRSRTAVEVAERYADAHATALDLVSAREAARHASADAVRAERHAEAEADFCDTPEYLTAGAERYAARAAESAAEERPIRLDVSEESYRRQGGYIVESPGSARVAADAMARKALATAVATGADRHEGFDFNKTFDDVVSAEQEHETHLLRDIFGNPLRPVAFNPAWLTPNVTALAGMIYDERAFDRLPIVTDALEEGGCGNADILSHCRGPGPHVRGCWVVDLLLGNT